ncbi:TonB-dependent receptor [Alkalimonas delamerensis]|uniref:TonB-dependent receptor n=1 Tax=Alkalimonas delamerensis TaxID=265981 RepID=A0ABT9GTQ3_9GAMM|nr:TonB-dependent receptor [Alkalimonas delamerensis]MDP4530356.1 TonB-dependent receptor [Alkalimonas delamerensis]
MQSFKSNHLSLAIIAALSTGVYAGELDQAEQAENVEVISVLGKRVSYANNSTDDSMKLQQAPIGNVMDMIDHLPGINIGQGDAFGSDDYTTTISMRGFVIDRADQQLGITIDGIPNGGSAYAGGSKANRFLDIENTRFVEVGQGSADIASASLDALGGTINFVSDNPELDRGARFAYTTGSHNARRYFARFDTGELFGHTSAYFSVSDSFNNRWMLTGSNGHADRLHVEFKSVTELADSRFTARLSYNDAHEDNYQPVSLAHFRQTPRWDGLTNVWTGDPDIDQNFAEAWSTLRENTLFYVKGEFYLTDALELDITPYLHLQNGRGDWLPPYQVFAADADGNRIARGSGASRTTYTHVDSAGNPILDGNNDQPGAKRVSSYRHTHYDKTRYGATANLSWELGTHRLRSGLWLESQQRNQTRDWHEVIDPQVYHHFDERPYWVHFDDDYRHKVAKFYLQDHMTFGDLQLTVGLQKYLVDISRTDNLNGLGKDSISSNSSWLPSAGLVYGLTDRLEVFAGYSENFKAIADSILESQQAEDLGDLRPETATNMDLGLRYFGDRISLSTALYNVRFNDRVVLLRYATAEDGTPNYLAAGDGNFDNVGGVRARGLESSLSWRLSQNLSLTSSLTLNTAEYSEDVLTSKMNPAGEPVLVQDYRKGDKIAGIPEQMLSLALNYHDGNYRAGFSGKYTGSYYGAAKHSFASDGSEVWNRDRISGHTIYNAYLGYEQSLGNNGLFQSVDLAFVLNNLTDKSYITGGSEGAYLIGAGRTASFTVSLSF